MVNYWERADLLALVCDVLLCFCHFPIWCPGSGVMLDCLDSDLCIFLTFILESTECVRVSLNMLPNVL